MLRYEILHQYNCWLERLGKRGVFNDEPFPDIRSNFPESVILESEFQTILKEYQQFLSLGTKRPGAVDVGMYGGNKGSTLPWNQSSENSEQGNKHLDWTTIFIKTCGKMQHPCPIQFSETCKLLESIPHAINIFYSHLGPQSTIVPHYGYFKGVLRYHLGLIIPPGECYLEVNGIKVNWKTGQGIVFDDMYLHSAVNNTDENRVVLFIDFLRPLPEPWNTINKLACRLVTMSKPAKNIEEQYNTLLREAMSGQKKPMLR